MKLNLPNLLIIFRILLIPVFLVFYMATGPYDHAQRIVATLIFLTAALTDLLDGYLARKWNTVSNFGKLMDPLADKMLVSAGLVALAFRQELAAWVVILIISREFWVTSLRMLALEQGKTVIAASLWGKIKTVTQITMLSVIMGGISLLSFVGLDRFAAWLSPWFIPLLVYTSVAATLFSAAEYTYSYRDVFKV